MRLYQKGSRKLSIGQSKKKSDFSLSDLKFFRQSDTGNNFWSKIKQKAVPVTKSTPSWTVFVDPTAGFMTNVATKMIQKILRRKELKKKIPELFETNSNWIVDICTATTTVIRAVGRFGNPGQTPLGSWRRELIW